MKKILYIFIAIVFIAILPSVSLAYNSGYMYTDYNNSSVYYYNHSARQHQRQRSASYTYPSYYNNYYPQYYPEYYPVYYPQYYTPCYDYGGNAHYYEDSDQGPNCNDRIEDWANRHNRPNHFLSSLYGSDNY